MARRKRVAVNARFLLKDRLEGIGNFTFESITRIVRSHPEVDFYFLFDAKYRSEFLVAENVTPIVLFPPARRHALWYWWFEISIARWLRKHSPDLFLSMDGFGCLHSSVPQVLVIHDLAFEHFRDNVPYLIGKYYRHFSPLYARKARRLATVSTFSKEDIATRYGIPLDRIDVVYNGVREAYQPLVKEAQEAVRTQYAAGGKYFLYVGAIHPRKNVARLLMAFDRFKQTTGAEHRLILAGRNAWDVKDVREAHAQMTCKDAVSFVGYLPNEEIVRLTAGAEAVVLVSLFEGFGVPIVEAMRCDVPVITSQVSSMPEIAGDAALLVDPESVDAIAHALQRLASDMALRASLVAAGRKQVEQFTWDRTAAALWSACERVLREEHDAK